MRFVAAFLSLLLVSQVLFAQDAEQTEKKIKLKDHPEFTPAKIQSQFVLGNWGVKRTELVKSEGKLSCNSYIHYYSRPKIFWEDEPFCSSVAEMFKGIEKGGMIALVVFLRNKNLRNQPSFDSNSGKVFELPHNNVVLIGYRDAKDFSLGDYSLTNSEANEVIREIYSLDMGALSQVLDVDLTKTK